MSEANKPSMLGAAVRAAKQASKPDDQIPSKPDSSATSKPDKEVNLSVRVPESQRRWWASQAKMTGKTMTDVIKAALTAEFGNPPD